VKNEKKIEKICWIKSLFLVKKQRYKFILLSMLSKNAIFSFLGHFRAFYGILDRLILKISQLTLRELGANAREGHCVDIA
jgi:hypothetical protein